MRFHAREAKVLVLKAGPRRKVTRTYKRLEALSRQMSRPVQADLIRGISTFKKKVSEKALFEAWKNGNYGHLMETIPWDQLHEDVNIRKPLQGAIADSAGISLKALPAPIRSDLRFDVKNPGIDRYLNTRAASLVSNIQNDTQQVIQQAVRRSFEQALRPDQIGRAIKGNIGLLPRHALAVDNYRVQLEAQGRAPDVVDALTGSYQDRLLNYRADMIGRTESRMAVNYSQLDIWKTAANSDLISRNDAKKVWVTDGDPCEICDPMDGVAVGLNDYWILSTGDQVEIPTESHPHCMCGMELDFGDGDIADDTEVA